MDRRVQLRAEVHGADRRFLTAFVDHVGDVHIDGHDLGPGTASISSDGEYEWSRTFLAADVPRLVEELEGRPGEDILDVLERSWTGPKSYELERRLRESSIPMSFWNWSG